MIQKKIFEEKRIKEENERIKNWEIKFDAEQKKKEDELLTKFNNAKEKEDERIKNWDIKFKAEQSKNGEAFSNKFNNTIDKEIIDNDTKRDDD